MFTVKFWKDALERAIRTFAQAIVAHVTVVEGWGFSLESVYVGLAASLTSVLLSLVASRVSDEDSASLQKS